MPLRIVCVLCIVVVVVVTSLIQHHIQEQTRENMSDTSRHRDLSITSHVKNIQDEQFPVVMCQLFLSRIKSNKESTKCYSSTNPAHMCHVAYLVTPVKGVFVQTSPMITSPLITTPDLLIYIAQISMGRHSISRVSITHHCCGTCPSSSPKLPFSTVGYAPVIISAQLQSSVMGREKRSCGSRGC